MGGLSLFLETQSLICTTDILEVFKQTRLKLVNSCRFLKNLQVFRVTCDNVSANMVRGNTVACRIDCRFYLTKSFDKIHSKKILVKFANRKIDVLCAGSNSQYMSQCPIFLTWSNKNNKEYKKDKKHDKKPRTLR